MFTLIEALSFRSLHYVRQPLGPFHVLVGPNASGKSTFLDVISFLSRFASDGLEAAVHERSLNFHDLVWGRDSARFDLAIEATIPEEHQPPWDSPDYDLIRYELAIGLDNNSHELRILSEQIRLGTSAAASNQSSRSGKTGEAPATLAETGSDWRTLVWGVRERELLVRPEQYVNERGEPSDDDYDVLVRPTSKKAIFDQLPCDSFPASTWLADSLRNEVRHVDLVNRSLRQPCPPGKGAWLSPDGSNLPWVVSQLQERDPAAYAHWLAHLQTALPDLNGIRIVERPEDKHRYLMVQYGCGLNVPSWTLSDGTLRLLALTVLAYVPDFKGVCLIEEPENSIHPLNVETVMQSLRSVYGGQVLVATHSPAILAVVDPAEILIFDRDEVRGTAIISGNEHPGLKSWKGEVSLGTLFAGGVLG